MRYFLAIFLILILFTHCNTQDGYIIRGEGSDIFRSDNTIVSLYEIELGNTLVKIDSTQMYTVSKFTIAKKAADTITPKIGLLLFDNKKEQTYNIIFLEQGLISAPLRNSFIRLSKTPLNDFKYKIDDLYINQTDSIQHLINNLLTDNDYKDMPIDSLRLTEEYQTIELMQSKWIDNIQDSIDNSKNIFLIQNKNLLLNFYKIRNIQNNGNNIFGATFFMDYIKNFKGFEVDYATTALSDSIKLHNKEILAYTNNQ